jgi:hypothetical protein
MEASTFLKAMPSAQLPLWQVNELLDVYVDSMVTDVSGEVMFMSAYGRDGALQQLLAAFHLPRTQGGIDRISLIPANEACGGQRIRGTVGDAKRLTKLTGKLPRGCFGPLSQVFIYDEALVRPDFESGRGWVLSFGQDESQHRDRIWAVAKQLLPIPVLDHWRDLLLSEIEQIDHNIVHMDKTSGDFRASIGRVRASCVRLDHQQITQVVSRLVRSGVLTRSPQAQLHNVGAAGTVLAA